MDPRSNAYQGCLLGMAVGDAMGYSVDKLSWEEITETYGPNGLLGFDLANGSADVTSYTQLAAFVCNGLILGTTRGNPEYYNRFLALAVREWAKSQQFRTGSERTRCWIAQVPALRRRYCMDTQLLDALTRENLGTPERPVFRSDTPSTLSAAAAVGLCWESWQMTPERVCRLGAEVVAFTHGRPESFVAGAFVSCAMMTIAQNPEKTYQDCFEAALEFVKAQLGEDYPESCAALEKKIQEALALTRDPELTPLEAMSRMECTTAAQCVAGAVYTACIHPGNFDEAMIVSVNHAGRSCAVGALVGAFLGIRMGAEELPAFYLESLECAPTLEELAQDLLDGRQVSRIFDDSWDQKYVQGMPNQ